VQARLSGFLQIRWAITSLGTHQFFAKPKNPKSKIPKSITQLHFILLCTVNMPAREINLNPFKDYIIAWFDDGMSSEEITERLANNHNIVCTNRTIKWRLKI